MRNCRQGTWIGTPTSHLSFGQGHTRDDCQRNLIANRDHLFRLNRVLVCIHIRERIPISIASAKGTGLRWHIRWWKSSLTPLDIRSGANSLSIIITVIIVMDLVFSRDVRLLAFPCLRTSEEEGAIGHIWENNAIRGNELSFLDR